MANQLRWMGTVLHVRLHVPLLDFTSTILTWYTSHCHTSFNSHCSLMRGDPHFIEGKYIKKYPKGSIFHSTSRAPHILWIDILLAQKKNTLIIFKPVNLFKKIVFRFPSLKNRMSQKRLNGLCVWRCRLDDTLGLTSDGWCRSADVLVRSGRERSFQGGGWTRLGKGSPAQPPFIRDGPPVGVTPTLPVTETSLWTQTSGICVCFVSLTG